MTQSTKRVLIEQLRSQLAREIEVLAHAAHQAREAATHEEAKPENDKDTRAIEAAYLAGAQADRVCELQAMDNALNFLELREFGEADPIELSAIVEVEGDGGKAVYFLAPSGGGMRAKVDGVEVNVITPYSPLGQELVGKAAGDGVEVRGPRGLRELEIVRVR